MMIDYVTIYAFLVVGLGFAAVSLIAAQLLRPDVPDEVKEATYECGMPAIGTTEVKTNIRFYVFALLFVIFDVETLFVFPWAVTVKEIGSVALIEMFIFLTILFLGLVYAWAKGALEWDVPVPGAGK
ncbi:MAG: NADH-quinone oxidoreductase subunit A [Elusimicrobia bacterium]|nr:MAG: NADH-quinone oxidoreductase subunit A [Elusimicrobiota bacterium]